MVYSKFLTYFLLSNTKRKSLGNSWKEINQGLPPAEENPLLFLTINPHNTIEVWGVTKHSEIWKYDGKE